MYLNIKITCFFRQTLLISLLILGSCKIYKTLEIVPVSKESLDIVTQYKPEVIVHLASESLAFHLISSAVRDDTLRGTLGDKIVKNHKYHNKSFSQRKSYEEDLLATIHIYTTLEDFGELKVDIPMNTIKSIEIHEKNVTETVATAVGFVALTATLVMACSCPQVESNDGQSKQFHGSLFPGAIFKSLKREDYLILDNVLVDEGDINLKIFNNLPETEYIYQLQVLEVMHIGYEYLGVSNENQFVGYNQAVLPTLSIAGSLNNITHTLSKRDNLNYDFSNRDSPKELNSITLKFDKSKFNSDTKLIIRGKQTQWLETVANYIFLNIGKSYNNWVKRKDRGSAKKWLDKNEWQGVALNVYIKVNDEWEYVGSHHDGGTLSMRELVMDIDLSESSSDVEIKLESAYKIWEIDYVGITDDWNEDLTVNSLDIQSVADEDGNDISNTLANADNNYHIQKGDGSYIKLIAKGSSFETSSIVLQGIGYYHHIRDYENKADLKFFMRLNDKLGVQDLSKALDLYKDINVVALRKK